MPTVADDIILSQLSYRDDASTPEADADKVADQKVLTDRWQNMEKAGWTYLGNQDTYFGNNCPDNGFQAHAYKDPNGKIVIAIRGTDEPGKDVGPDVVLALHMNIEQSETALAFTHKVIEKAGKPTEIHLTGHSLGAHLAQEVVKELNSLPLGATKATGSGFNGPGMGDGDSESDTFINIHDQADQINHAGGEHLGGEIDLDGDKNFWQIGSSHSSATLANTIINDYPHLAGMDTSVLAAMSADSRDEMVVALCENANKIRKARLQNEAINSNYTNSTDSIFDVIDRQVDAYTTEIEQVQGKLAKLPQEGEYLDREEREAFRDLEREFDSLNGKLNDLQNAKNELIQKENITDVSPSNPETIIDLDTSNKFFIDNDPDFYQASSDGTIVKSQTIAGNATGTSSIILNSDNPPQTREELASQLQELGMSEEEAEEIASNSTLPAADNDTVNAEFGGFGEEQQQADNPDGFADPYLDEESRVEAEREAEAAAHQKEVEANTNIRAADLGVMQAQRDLEKAIESEDTLEIIAAGLEYLSKFEDRVDLDVQTGLNTNNGVLSEYKESVADILSDAINLGLAMDDGDGWAITRESTHLLQDIETYLAQHYNDENSSNNVSGNNSATLGLAVAGFDLAEGIEDGDGWAISQSSVSLLEGIDNYLTTAGDGTGSFLDNKFEFDAGTAGYAFQAVGSAIGLAVNIASLEDAFESGDATQIAYATASTVNNAIITYNAAVNLAGYSQGAIGSVPSLGYVVAAIQLLDGDAEGAAISVATTALLSAGPYGWIGALALQLGSATRNCDGQIIDKENIEAFSDDLAPGGGQIAVASMAAIETASEITYDVYEGTSYLSGFGLDMYEDLGVDIPEEMEADFVLAQTVMDANNPLRTAEYFTDLENFSLADFWDSTYITPSVMASVDHVENWPDSIKSHITSDPKVAVEMIQAALSPDSIVTMFKGFFGADDPPAATASFTLDANGNVVMNVHGDDSMRESAEAQGGSLLTLMQDYKDDGGRLLIAGHLPSFTVTQGEGASLNYHSETGGKAALILDDSVSQAVQLRGVLLARDRGERVDSAVKVATNSSGEIDFSQVDQIMASHGFAKKGINYTYGETTERYGTSYSSGIVVGGGNVGPQEQHFNAKSSNFTSLPLRTSSSPSQQLGEISRIVSLKNIFSGAGSELLAMALTIPGGLLALAATAENGQTTLETDSDYVKPLDAVELETYLSGTGDSVQSIGEPDPESKISQKPLPAIDNPEQMQNFLQEHWSDLLQGDYTIPGLTPDSVYRFRDTNHYNGFFSDGSSVPSTFPKKEDDEYYELADVTAPQLQVDNSEPAAIEVQTVRHGLESFTSRRLSAEEIPEEFANIEEGAVFLMPEDSILRFLPAELAEDSATGTYVSLEENFTFIGFSGADNGRVWQEDSGDIRFEPTPGFVGISSFTYTLMTPDGELVEHRATVLVENVNDAPQLTDDSYNLQEGEVLYLDRLLINDSDPEGDILQFDHFHGLEHGSISLLSDKLAFVPDSGYFGDVEFSYWAYDHANSYPVMAQVNIQYEDVNTGVQTEDDHFIILEETSLTTSTDKLLANDVEHDGETVVFTGLGEAVHGEVTEATDGSGSIIFTPEPDYTGTGAGFYYKVEDASGNISTGWADVEVLDIREAPVVISSSHTAIAEDEVLPFTPEEIATFVYDPDGDNLHLESITNVTGGTISIVGGVYSFTPDADFSGQASFDYQANDNHQGVVSGHLEFEVTAVNDPIQTGNDRLTTFEDQAVTTTVADLLVGDTDVDGSVVDFVSLGEARNGRVHIDDTGTITFTPDTDYAGTDAGFEYIVKDSEGLESTGWVEVVVTGVNDAPLVAETHLNVNEDTVLTFNQDILKTLFTDVDGDLLSITAIEALEGGSIHEAAGVYSFIPDSDYHGDGRIQLTVTDNMGAVAESTVSLDILAVDDPANMGLDSLSTSEEQAVTVSVSELLAAGSDADGTLSFSGLGGSSHGTASINSSGEITFIPDTNYYGNEAGFSYSVTDSTGGGTTATVTVQVTGSNDPPTIIAHSLEAMEDTPVVFNQETISRIINDLDGDNIVLTDLTSSSGGTMSESDGIYTFTPDPDYHGPAILSYTATDMNGGTVSGEVNLDILPIDDPTSFGTDAFTTKEEQTLITSVSELMANDSDTDGDGELQFAGIGLASHGQVQLAANGTVEFTPEKNYFGEEAGFAYTLYDSEGNEATGWVTVQVTGVNDRPEITENRIFINENEPLTFDQDELSKFIFDPDGDLLSLDVVTSVEGGQMELSDGVYTFTPDADFYGETSLEYLATDSGGLEVTGKLHLGVTPVNDLPKVDYSSGNGIEDNEILFNIADLMDGTTDVEDGTNLRFAGIESSVNGDVYIDSENIAHFVPLKDYFGSGFFRYKVMDSEGGIGLGYVGVDITGVNDIPVALDDEKILAWSNNSYENVFLAATFLDNDYDVDGDPLTIVAADDAEFGTVSVDSSGNIHYTASSEDWVGVDSFTYTISDTEGSLSQAVAQIDVKLNTSPDIYSEVLETDEDVISIISQAELLANDVDINGDSMYITGVDQAKYCNVELMADGRIRFTPDLNYNNLYPQPVSFRYTVTDGISDPVSAIAVFDITPVNDAPNLQGERITGAIEDNSFSFAASALLTNDMDVETASAFETDSITFDATWGASNGTVSYNDALGEVYYTPNQDFNGADTFSYRVVDSHGATSVVQSEIYVTPVNDNPTVMQRIGSPAEETVNNYYSITELLSNDFDVDGDSLSISDVYKINGHCNVKISGGNIVVVPERGEDRLVIGYTVSDGHGGETESTLTIPDIIEHNYAPTFSGLYDIGWKDSHTVWFNFHAEDRNGGNSWGNYGDIASISASAPNTGSITQDGANTGTGTFKFKGDVENASLTLTVADQAGATGTIFVRLSHLNGTDGHYHYSPVILDLDGDGVELMDVTAGISFDWNLDGMSEKTGWAGQDDGFLVYDYDNDQAVRYANELALKEYKPGATTDLEGLQAFDTNVDGVFDQSDDEWNSFGIWQDKNSNGQTDNGEFSYMNQTDITSIELQSDEEFREESGNVIYGETTFHRENGSVGEVADVGLNGEAIELTEVSNTLDPETLLTGESQEAEEPIMTPQTDFVPDEFGAETSRISSGTSPLETTSVSSENSEAMPQNSSEEKNEETKENLTTDNISLDEAVLDRQLCQLVSDMATSTAPAGETQDMIFIEPDSSATYIDPIGEIDQDTLTLA